MVTFAGLRALVTVAETGSVGGAARTLGVTQPAVSAALASLSADLGVALVERDGRGIALTEPGALYVDYARRILGLIDEGALAARTGDRPDHGTVRVGAVTTAAEFLVPGLLAAVAGAYPDLELTLAVDVRDRVFAQLASRSLDLVIAGRPPTGADLVSRAQRPNDLIVVAAPHLGSDAPWLLRGAGSGTRETTLGLLAAADISPRMITLGSHGAVVAGAIQGLGRTLVSREAVRRPLADGALDICDFPGTPLARPWHAVTGPRPTASTRLLLAAITDATICGDLTFAGEGSRRARHAQPG